MKIFNHLPKLLLTILLFLTLPAYCQDSIQKSDEPVHSQMSFKAKQEARKAILEKMLDRDTQNQTFFKMHQYMNKKFEENKRKNKAPEPKQLITDTFDKTSSLFDKTKSFVGNSFNQQYQPEIIEANINKYLWLKGICFFALRINEAHKIAISYFYQPGNESIKQDFILDIVKYSYPEVKDIPENKLWLDKMSQVMDHIAYKIFDVKRY